MSNWNTYVARKYARTHAHCLAIPNETTLSDWSPAPLTPHLEPHFGTPIWFLCIMREIPGYGFVAFWGASGSHLVIGRPFAFRLRPTPGGQHPPISQSWLTRKTP